MRRERLVGLPDAAEPQGKSQDRNQGHQQPGRQGEGGQESCTKIAQHQAVPFRRGEARRAASVIASSKTDSRIGMELTFRLREPGDCRLNDKTPEATAYSRGDPELR